MLLAALAGLVCGLKEASRVGLRGTLPCLGTG